MQLYGSNDDQYIYLNELFNSILFLKKNSNKNKLMIDNMKVLSFMWLGSSL